MDYRQLGKRILSQRRIANMTQKQLSELAGISMSFLGNIERGTKKASIDTLVAISNALRISPDVLLQDSLETGVLGLNGLLTSEQKSLINDIASLIRERDV